MLKRLFLAVCLVLGIAQVGYAADDPKVITWEDLVPKMAMIENPFDDLKSDVLDRFSYVMRAREDLKMGLTTEDSAEYKDALAIERELLEEGVDVKGLIIASEKLIAEVNRRNALVNKELDGAVVRMPGYALPLEQSADGVTEFLLVPYVGACIHVPPPPANQIVYVKLSTAYKVASLYEPVWITGRMTTEAATRNLTLVDGDAPVETGYRMDGIAIEPYKQ